MLETRVRDLTGDGVARLRKPLGIPGRPYPMRDTVFAENEKGERVQVQRLGVLENAKRPLNIDSDRSYAEVFGMAYREMPTPSMLPMFFDAISLRRPESKRRLQYLKGAPGAGKTYMSELIGRMRDPRGPIIVNCGDKNLGELLYETVLDLGTDRDFYAELEIRLAKGVLNPLSVRILHDSLGPAFVEKDGKATIDWNAIGETIKDHQTGDTNRLDDVTKRQMVARAVAGLEKVRGLENLGHLGGNALGMATQEGPLIRAWKEGREIVLDEYNKRKEGTDGGLQRILQFLAGEIDECIAENTLKDKGEGEGQFFVFRRADMRIGFFATLTGNDETDGSTTFELSQSVHSRTAPEKIPQATIEDWQHRICQILTGMPISTIYRSDEAHWKDDPEFFGRWLMKARTTGLSGEQIKNIPQQQMRLLSRWQDVMEAAERMAKFYHGWSMMVDPDSELARSGQLSKLMMEINDVYKSEISIDFRRITEHVNKAVEFRPEVLSAGSGGGYKDLDFEQPPALSAETFDEDPMLRYGTRLAHIIVNHISKTTSDIGKVALHRQLMKHAADCGIVAPNLLEARPSSRKTLAQLLDEDLYDDRNLRAQAEMIRKMVCGHLREKYGASGASDDDIVSIPMMQSALQSLSELESLENDDGQACETQDLVVMNDDADTVSGQPLQLVSTLDVTGTQTPPPDSGALLPETQLLATLAMPRIGDHNLKSLWNKAISKSGLVSPGEGPLKDRALMVAEGDGAETLHLTTVMVRADKTAQATPLHVIWNVAQDRALIIGNHLDSGVANLFNYRGIIFVSRDDKDAEAKIKIALGKTMAVTPEDEKRLKAAFLLRNQMDDVEKEDAASLPALLSGAGVTATLPHYILNHTLRPEMKAA